METPEPPDSLPKYIAEGLPKQDDATLRATRAYIDDLLAYREQSVDPSELPDSAEPVDQDDGKGTLVKEMVTCGDESCKCASGDKHGPYLYRYFREDGKLVSEYEGKA